MHLSARNCDEHAQWAMTPFFTWQKMGFWSLHWHQSKWNAEHRENMQKRVQLEYFNTSLCSIFTHFPIWLFVQFFTCVHLSLSFGLIYQDDLQLANQFKLKNVYFCLTSIFLTLLLLRYKTINIYCHFPFAIRSQVFAKSCTLFMRLFTSQVFCFGEKAAINESSKKI